MLEGIRKATIADCQIGDIVGIRGGDRHSLAIVGAQVGDAFNLITLHSLSGVLPERFVIMEVSGNETVLKICSDYRFLPNIEPLGNQVSLSFRPDAGDLVFADTGLFLVGETYGHIAGLRQFSPLSGKLSDLASGAARLQFWRILTSDDVELFVRS